MSAFSLNLCLR